MCRRVRFFFPEEKIPSLLQGGLALQRKLFNNLQLPVRRRTADRDGGGCHHAQCRDAAKGGNGPAMMKQAVEESSGVV